MFSHRVSLIFILLLIVLYACSPPVTKPQTQEPYSVDQTNIPGTDTQVQERLDLLATKTASAALHTNTPVTPSPFPTRTPNPVTPSVSNTPIPSTTQVPASQESTLSPTDPAPFSPQLAGMVYEVGENYFRFDEYGEVHHLFFGPYRFLAPLEEQIGIFLDYEKSDLFLIDYATSTQINLTNTPELFETDAAWVPGLEDKIIFTAIKPGEPECCSAGWLYAINSDGSGRTPLDIDQPVVNFALSLDGQTIAYGGGETGYLYNWEDGITEFNPRDYGMDLPEDLFIVSPSWSPDGKQIAWHMRGYFNEQHQNAYGIFDLEEKTLRLVHPHGGNGYHGYPFAAHWSPDGQWLALFAHDPDPEGYGVWLVNVNRPEEEYFMGISTVIPLWSPDGKWLAYHHRYEKPWPQKVWLYNLENDFHWETPLPLHAMAIYW